MIAPVTGLPNLPDDLEIRSNGNVIISLDYDNNEASQSFEIKAGDGSTILKVDEEVEKKQVDKLKKFKEKRNNSEVKEKLKSLKILAETPPEKVSAKKSENLMYPIIACVEAGATVGEISNALREVFGEYTESF